ncbi:hypothetical protein ACFX13_033542 [Malus domestica]|uniref:Uncharacterized protein n=1 Tax=Malus baccata TaxID=106549 RepID=A0A540N3H4_MALBA|nr:hypothetical protein C1H46_008811 [Malus baccata]
MMVIAMTGTPTFSATSIAKHIISSIMTQLKGGRRVVVEPYDSSSFLVRVMSRSPRSGLVTDLSDETMSIKGGMERGQSGGRPSGRDSKWRVGKRAERAWRWVRRRWLCSVLRKVTWMPAWHSSCAKLSIGVMWPCAGNGNNNTCAADSDRSISICIRTCTV